MLSSLPSTVTFVYYYFILLFKPKWITYHKRPMIKTLLPDKISLAPIFTKLIPNALIVYKHKSILILT